MYGSDSFFTLSTGGQIGLAALSMTLACGMLVLTYRASRGRPFALRILIALLLFAAFEWLSPQIYYIYYRLIIQGLPLQWVIGMMPDPGAVPGLLTFTETHDLSAHGRGALGWMMVLLSVFALRKETG